MSLINRAEQIRIETAKRANTAERVGSLFVDIIKDYSGRLSYAGNGTTTINLVEDEPKQLEGFWTQSRESNVILNTNDIEVIESMSYRCYGMITFDGKQGTSYELQIRKNNQVICTCNPVTEVANNRTTNLVSFDVDDFVQGDKLSLWVVSSETESIEIYKSKLILCK